MMYVQDDIYEICLKKSLYGSDNRIDVESILYGSDNRIDVESNDGRDMLDERDPRLLQLGSRVKRGRDWKWKCQDGFGPGTVIGHRREGECDLSFIKELVPDKIMKNDNYKPPKIMYFSEKLFS